MQKIMIKIEGHEVTANLLDNATSQALIKLFPLDLDLLNLYSREMTYRFKRALPANELGTSGYQVGDIAYWAPRHSFVIFYKQTGEIIGDLQKIGQINDSLDFLKGSGNKPATFTLGGQ
ncbi:cyclophilin-like fold protein [Levilactobacillus cerevisiae]|uniref:cyclophilin-like fold protein n=1 Tax=Levilactobacillus cerevisiae TaxID=1704076 RepID=UPI000F7B0055|nr:cyclophilin-like fold protein [Levilactobacillus cerevisiae]